MGLSYCPHCGDFGYPKKKRPGSGWMTLFLLLIGIVPGIFYALWRVTNRYPVCRRCGARDPVPADSPRALAATGGVPVEPKSWLERFFST